jgi:twitching motility protein PilT
MAVTTEQLLKTLVERGGEELYLGVNTAPQIRIDGVLVPLDMPMLTNNEVEKAADRVLLDRERTRLRDGDLVIRELQLRGLGRFRITAYHDLKGAILAAKFIPWEIMGYRELGLVENVFDPLLPGLTLIGGTPRSGRSATAAAVLDKINRECHCRIMTVSSGDWLVRHTHKSGIVEQIVLGDGGLQPDQVVQIVVHGSSEVVLIDEIYDTAAVRLAIHLAQIGLKVAMVTHGRSARDVVEGLLSLFPAFMHPTLQAELSHVLRCVTSQRLLPKASGKGRVMAMEVCDFSGETARMAIERGQTSTIDRLVSEAGGSLEDALGELCTKRLIEVSVALGVANDAEALKKKIGPLLRPADRRARPK